MELDQVDFTTAFLNGDVDEEIYMALPEGFTQGSKVARLNKSIYGLKQASRAWYFKLDQAFTELGFTHSAVEHCLYIWRRGDIKVIIPIYVDDQLIASNHCPTLNWVKEELGKKFKMKDLGPASYIL